MLKVSFRVAAVVQAAMFALSASVAEFAQFALAADSVATRSDAPKNSVPVRSISIQPSEISLKYLSDRQRILVQAKLADGSTRDVTKLAEIEVQDPLCVRSRR